MDPLDVRVAPVVTQMPPQPCPRVTEMTEMTEMTEIEMMLA